MCLRFRFEVVRSSSDCEFVESQSISNSWNISCVRQMSKVSKSGTLCCMQEVTATHNYSTPSVGREGTNSGLRVRRVENSTKKCSRFTSRSARNSAKRLSKWARGKSCWFRDGKEKDSAKRGAGRSSKANLSRNQELRRKVF